ncbi:hypothetical protein BGX27_005982 [Mortierella sp. AM989]|nr:hypothetical protein BGX27_005982 [Mortierella sp. AM989]
MQVRTVFFGKQTITDTQSVNPLGTMSDYWHSLGAPRIQDLHQQYMQINPSSTTDPLTMKLSVHTATHSEQFPPMQQLISPPESSASNSPYSFHDKTITENCYIDCSRVVAKEPTSTLPISSVPLSPSLQSLSGSDSTSEATSKVHPKCSDTSLNHPSQLSSIEDGQPLEQRSISLSDNTADLPELSETYGSCSKEILAQNAKPQLGAPKAKFFLYDSEDSEGSDMEQESMTITPHTIGMSPFIRQQTEEHHHDGDCEDFDTPDEQHDIDDEDFFGKKMPIVSPFQYQSNKSDLSSFRSGTGVRPHPPYCAVMGRRQSLLSDLLLAEKQQKSQQSDSLSIPSAPNSDGETTALHKATVPVSQGYLMSPQQQHRRGSYMERSGINHISKNRSHNVSAMHEDMSDRTVPSLVRTKKVYKNLAELAKAKAPATPENSLLLSASPRATKSTAAKAATSIMNTTTTTPSLSSNTTCILSTSPAISTNGWTRTQVQVQIQSLVTHSTSTAQRALLSASATLADVLFRTTH